MRDFPLPRREGFSILYFSLLCMYGGEGGSRFGLDLAVGGRRISVGNQITSVDVHSPAERAGIRAGERLVALNGHEVVDVLDYRFYGYDARVKLTLEDAAGRRRTVSVRKAEGEDLGLNFETYLMDKARSCANRCIFCFVDQMPPGMRETLYFKDDDARLSFLMGNYLTLTNLSQREIQRIMDLHISPINVSVHTTDPELRCEMLRNRKAGESMEVMRRFAAAGITMNCQIVACPGINDGPALDRTLRELGELYPAVVSVAVVPVGLTRYRDGLPMLQPYTAETAEGVIRQVEGFAADFMEKNGTSLVWCSDEFYLLAGRELPEKAYYEDMDQLENGVGMLRLLLQQAELAAEEDFADLTLPTFSVATGVSAAPYIQQVIEMLKKDGPTLCGTVYPIQNDFFGHTITVSGLITGQDLIAQLKGKELGQHLLIPSNMLRAGEQVFLDDVTLSQVEEALGVPVTVVDAESGFDLVDAILGRSEQTSPDQAPLREDGEYYRYNPPSGRR